MLWHLLSCCISAGHLSASPCTKSELKLKAEARPEWEEGIAVETVPVCYCLRPQRGCILLRLSLAWKVCVLLREPLVCPICPLHGRPLSGGSVVMGMLVALPDPRAWLALPLA